MMIIRRKLFVKEMHEIIWMFALSIVVSCTGCRQADTVKSSDGYDPTLDITVALQALPGSVREARSRLLANKGKHLESRSIRKDLNIILEYEGVKPEHREFVFDVTQKQNYFFPKCKFTSSFLIRDGKKKFHFYEASPVK